MAFISASSRSVAIKLGCTIEEKASNAQVYYSKVAVFPELQYVAAPLRKECVPKSSGLIKIS
jgi:hypothetical protein